MAPVVAFILLANTFSWLIWLPLLASALGWKYASPTGYLHFLGGLGPMMAAFVVVRWYGGQQGVRGLASRCVLWRVPARWHVVAWLSPVIIYLVAAVIVRFVWGSWPDLSRFGRSEEFPDLPVLAYWTANIVCYGWGEETGWRGLLLPMLQQRTSALSATLLVTPVWALWHLPLFFFGHGYTAMGAADIVGWLLSLLTGAVLMTWLFNSARGSILVVAVFHGTLDVAFNSPSPGDLALVVGVLVTLWGIAILVSKSWVDLSSEPRQTLELRSTSRGRRLV